MRSRIQGLLFSIAGWMAAALFFCLIRFVGLKSVPQFQGLNFAQINFAELWPRFAVLGCLMGIAAYLIEIALDRQGIRRKSYGFLIVIQCAVNLAMVIAAALFAGLVDMRRADQGFHWEPIQHRILSLNFIVMLVYISVVSSLFGFLKQVDRKFGPGNLRRLLLGMYHHPREEERIFMFLDMKNSTTHAESLGHVRFSKMIQECFIDLSAVTDTGAQIYQYVGDEVILYWDVEAGLRNANCIRAYLQFRERLQSRSDYYQAAYDVVPTFKAGLHIGNAMVLEVGEIKREISYLGDLLNTAARIQGECNRLGEGLLVSEALIERLRPLPADLSARPMGEVELRGRQKAMHIYSVGRAAKASK